MKYASRTGAVLAALACCFLLVPSPAGAQGNGRGNAFGHNKRPSGNSSSTSSTSGSPGGGSGDAAFPPQPDGGGVRNFGSWLDDASVMAPGSGFMSFAASYWRMSGFTEIDVPAVDVGVGLTRRVQVGASVPVYHAGEPGGPVTRGVGDLFLNGKIQLRDPAAAGNGVGMALVPVVEVLSAAPAAGGGRVSWGIPAAVEVQRDGWRAYGSTGYFSRGAIFGSGALEVALGSRAWVTGTISQSRSLKQDPLSEALGLSRTRTDVSGGASAAVSEGLAVFGSVGRTISRTDANSATMFLTGGVAINFEAWP